MKNRMLALLALVCFTAVAVTAMPVMADTAVVSDENITATTHGSVAYGPMSDRVIIFRNGVPDDFDFTAYVQHAPPMVFTYDNYVPELSVPSYLFGETQDGYVIAYPWIDFHWY